MSDSPQQIFMVTVFIIVFVYLFMVLFEYLFWRVSLLNPGTLIGCGVAGLVGVLGFSSHHWNAATGAAVCLLGGCIGSGLFRFNEDPPGGQNKYKAIGSNSGCLPIGR